MEIITEELSAIYLIIVETVRHLNSAGAAVIEENMVQMNVLAAYACFSVWDGGRNFQGAWGKIHVFFNEQLSEASDS